MDRKSTLHDFAAGETGRGPGVPSSLTNNPRSGQWDGRRMSKRMIADYKTFIVTDGEGVRNENVTGFRFALVESDSIPVQKRPRALCQSRNRSGVLREPLCQNLRCPGL